MKQNDKKNSESKKKDDIKCSELNKSSSEENKYSEENNLTLSLEDNVKLFKKAFKNDETFMIRYLNISGSDIEKCCILYIDGMVDTKILNESIIKPILSFGPRSREKAEVSIEELMNNIIASGGVKKATDTDTIISAIISGDTALLQEGSREALLISARGWEKRSVEESPSEKVIRGPREGFTESINDNLSMIRRRLQTADLKFIFKELGKYSRTKVCICYIEGIASDKILGELVKRLDKIDIDGILDSGYIQELIRDDPLSPFETIGNTERPDAVAAKLLEGRFGLVVDGSPVALTLPFVFIEHFQSNEDYYNNYVYASINRMIRLIGEFLSMSVPAIYIAFTTFQQEMIPTSLLVSISASRHGVPFPTVIEALMMLFIFEVLREAGIRMPSPIGQAVSIAGALVLGQASVEARLVSSPMIIVASLTGITGLLNPKMKGSSIIVRLVLIFLSTFLGLYGFVFGIIGLFIHLFGMRSFGIPYMLKIGSVNPNDISDTVVRAPLWVMYYRPQLLSARNYVRRSKKGR